MMKLHHIGIACEDIEAEIASISRINTITERTPVIYDPQQDATVVLLTLEDGSRIELITGRQVETILKKNITYYHLCFEIGDIDEEIDRLVAEGAILLSPPKPALLFQGRRVAFLHVSYGIIELLV